MEAVAKETPEWTIWPARPVPGPGRPPHGRDVGPRGEGV